MDAPSSTPELSRELDDLRRRAYGPDADIHRDPDAAARLSELEAFVRTPQVEAPAVEEELPADADPPTDASAHADDPAAASESIRPPHFLARVGRRVPVWALIATAGVIGLILGVSLPALLAPRPDAVLASVAEQREVDLPEWAPSVRDWLVIEGELTSHEPFEGFEVLTGHNISGAGCVLVVLGQEWIDGRCAAGDLAPSVDFVMYPGTLNPLDEPFPVGSLIRFTLRDDVVEVWKAEAPDNEST
ncbi:hypothetical protein [Microbacterium sp. 2FI]|uniref:hypothetical protein n=1 Tax=Microbacterium sp. 2FI TaxID=2502193 RepID=UPI0010F747F5|nr:hypothetical protein [Microbacterium sp. 2FI]